MRPASRTKLCETSAERRTWPCMQNGKAVASKPMELFWVRLPARPPKTLAAIIKHQICNLKKLKGVLLHYKDPYSKQLMKLQRMMSRQRVLDISAKRK